MNIIWKDIKGFEDFYQVSNNGEIRSKDRRIEMSNGSVRNNKSKILRQRKNNRGYCIISLTNENHKKDFLVHRIVASHFIENPSCLLQVNHKNGIKDDNTVSNLEWCDQSYNMKEAYRLGLRSYVKVEYSEDRRKKLSDSSKNHKIGAKKVLMFNDNVFIREFECPRDAAEFVGGNKNSIRDCCNPNRKMSSYKGYVFKYK